jgi:hypothetical protein
MLPGCRATKVRSAAGRSSSQFHANSQSAEWSLTSMASHPGAATLLEDNEI